jgi:hypothetical protein
MRTNNLSASEDAILTSCEVFGGDAAGAAELCEKLDAQLTTALKTIETLEEQISNQP